MVIFQQLSSSPYLECTRVEHSTIELSDPWGPRGRCVQPHATLWIQSAAHHPLSINLNIVIIWPSHSVRYGTIDDIVSYILAVSERYHTWGNWLTSVPGFCARCQLSQPRHDMNIGTSIQSMSADERGWMGRAYLSGHCHPLPSISQSKITNPCPTAVDRWHLPSVGKAASYLRVKGKGESLDAMR